MKNNPEIYLRKCILEDVDFMLQMENDPEIWSVSQTVEPYSREEIENFLDNSKHDLYLDHQLRLMVVLKEIDQPIGSVDLFELDADKRSAGIGITILKDFRNMRFGTKALKMLVQEAFNELGLLELNCTIFTNNKSSIKLFESKGFKCIKLLKKNTEFMGLVYDEYLYQLKKK